MMHEAQCQFPPLKEAVFAGMVLNPMHNESAPHAATMTRPPAGPRQMLIGSLTGFALVLACVAAPVPAAPTRGNVAAVEESDVTDTCLPVRGGVGDSVIVLRVAMPPLDAQGGTGSLLQAIVMRLASASSHGPGAKLTGSDDIAVPGRPAAPLSPVARTIVDGGAELMAGRHVAAERALAPCAQQAADQGDTLAAAACANNLALAYAAQGRHTLAREELARALAHYETPRAPPADLKLPLEVQATIDQAMAGVPALLARLPPEQRSQIEAQLRAQRAELAPRMRDAAVAAWQQSERLATRRGIERTTLNLGNLALATGRLADAQTHLQRALDLHPADESPSCKAAAAMDLARFYRRLGRAAESQALLARHRVARDREREAGISLFELGSINLAAARAGESSTVTDAPVAPAARANADVMDVPLDSAALGEPAGRFGDALLAQSLAQATRDTTALPPLQAMGSWQRLAVRAAAGQRPDLAYVAHAALMRLYLARGDASMAIFHGKRAANLAQATRAGLADHTPSRDARRAFLRDRRQVYVALAQLLLDEQRLLEAEAVLQLLKEDEGQQFADRGGSARLGNLALSHAEQAQMRQDDAVASRLLQAEHARVAAAASLPLGAGAAQMLSAAQIEAVRLRLGLAVAGLPAQLKREPLQLPGRSDEARATLRDLRGFFLGPERRLEQFLTRLIEDASQFTPRVNAQDVARLADTLKRVPQLRAELAPMLREAVWVDGAAGTITFGGAGQAGRSGDAVGAWDYVAAEPMERMWRSIREADQIEAGYLRQVAERASAPSRGAGTVSTAETALADDTRTLLASQPVPTVLLYYLPGDERLDVLLVSASGRRHWRQDLRRADLNRQIDVFTALLRRSAYDPRPAAQALYARLFAPVAQAVADSGARVVALSLADKLRFVPFAALHDGQGWLVQRYALAVHPGGTLLGRLAPASANWHVAAFGASAGGGEFPPLLNVQGEINSIVRQSGSPGGALPGQAWVDRAFTAQRLRTALAGGAQVLHIASHFKFVGGDAQASYLLLGDGTRLSLRDLAGADYRLDRTELVTLSACATGLSADDTYGQEVDGLAALLMGQGAPSVLASLWEVNDKSTAALMATLYRLRENGQLSRAMALQQAQLAMIGATSPPPPSSMTADGQARGVSRVRLPGDPEPAAADPAFAPAVALGDGHPFHWAAFVLMGNWR